MKKYILIVGLIILVGGVIGGYILHRRDKVAPLSTSSASSYEHTKHPAIQVTAQSMVEEHGQQSVKPCSTVRHCGDLSIAYFISCGRIMLFCNAIVFG